MRRPLHAAATALVGGMAFVGGFIIDDRSVARAGDDDKLLWSFGDDSVRYDLDEDVGARMAPEPGYAIALEKVKLVGDSEFADARRFKDEVRDVSDLLWHYALSLPVGDFRAGGSFPIDDAFALPSPQGQLVAKGKDDVKRQGARTSTRTTLEFQQDKLPQNQKPWILKGSSLTLDRVWDVKKKVLVEVRFELVLVRTTKNEETSATFRHVGRVTFAGKVDTSAKAFLNEVSGAIKRGTIFLQERLAKRLNEYKASKATPNQALGYVALPTFALLRSGVPPAQLKDAFDYMATSEWKEVYSVSLYVMCLEAKSIRRDEVPPAAGGRTVARFRKGGIPKQDRDEMIRAARWIAAVRKHGEGWWSYEGDAGRALEGFERGGNGTQGKNPNGPNPADEGGPKGAERGDRSNSQFATLALHCAATSDCPIDEAVWREVVGEIVKSQEANGPDQSIRDVEWTAAAPQGVAPDGGSDPFQPMATRSRETLRKEYGEGSKARGWGYSMREATRNAYGSMSGAGLSSIAIAREALRRLGKLDAETDEKTRRAMHDGVAWFVKNWTVARNPNNGGWYYYYLYSIEKAMETAGVEKLGPHEWWREGCAQLLALEDQKAPQKLGSWNSGNVEDTSFALLFLNRATLPATIVTQDNLRVASGERDPDAWDQVFVDGTGHVRLRQVLYALETATPDLIKDRLKIAEKGFEILEEERRPRLVPDLLRLLVIPSKDVHRFASKALKIAAGTDDEARARAFYAKWQALAHACEHRDYDAIARIRAMFRDAESTMPLKRAACVALSRLRAIEAVGDLIAELSDKDASYRRHVATTIVQLVGGEKKPYEPAGADGDRAKQVADWKSWWESVREGLVFDEEARRQVEALAVTEKRDAAKTKLKQMGKRAGRQLIDGLIDPATKAHAHALLKEITGLKLPAESAPWLAWWEKSGGK